MSEINTKRSWFALTVSHMCGMIDLAALPIWVGGLVAFYAFMPAQAGGLVTLFLIGALLCSLFVAPRFDKINGRWLSPLGFIISATAFAAMAQTAEFVPLAVLHFIAGAGTGLGVSIAHGAMGRTSNPHRIFAYGGIALSIAAVIYLGGTPQLIEAFDRTMLFYVFAGVMAFAALVNLAFFPNTRDTAAEIAAPKQKFSGALWLVIFGILLMGLNNSMILSFTERVGEHRGFAAGEVQTFLVAMAIAAIFAPMLAAFLQHRFNPRLVGIVGALIHGAVCLGAMVLTDLPIWGPVVTSIAFMIVFTHTFIFGHLAALDPSGRAVAATPAMMMTGSAIGPFVGGAMVQTVGYEALGYLAIGIAVVASLLFMMSRNAVPTAAAPIAAE